MGFVNETLKDGSRQTIDKEKKISLKEIYWGGVEPYARFSLSFNKKHITFGANYSTHLNKKNKKTVCWKVFEIDPIKSKKTRKEIIPFIQEALSHHGLRGNTEHTEQTIVTFDPYLTLEK